MKLMNLLKKEILLSPFGCSFLLHLTLTHKNRQKQANKWCQHKVLLKFTNKSMCAQYAVVPEHAYNGAFKDSLLDWPTDRKNNLYKLPNIPLRSLISISLSIYFLFETGIKAFKFWICLTDQPTKWPIKTLCTGKLYWQYIKIIW